MKRLAQLTFFAAALMLLILPARAEKAAEAVPTQAIGNSTMLAVYIDVTQFDASMIETIGNAVLGLAGNEQLQDQGLAVPLGDPKQLIDMLTTLRGSFLQAGGEGLLATIEMPGEDDWSPPMTLLAKTNDKLDANALTAMIRTLGDGEMDATLEAIGGGWQNVAMKTKDGQPVTIALPKPDADVFAAFNKQLTQHEKPVFAVAFRMQEEMRKMLDQAEGLAQEAQPGAADGQDAQAQMMTGMLMGMFKPIRQLDTIGLAVSKDGQGSMIVDVQMSFFDAASAEQFGNVYNTLLMFAPMLAAQAGGQGQAENMPDPATINNFFMKLKMEVAGDSLKLRLDKEFFDLAEKLSPLFEGMAEQQGEGLNL